jgi:hypothetical protein
VLGCYARNGAPTPIGANSLRLSWRHASLVNGRMPQAERRLATHDALRLRLKNSPALNTDKGVARGVSARISFFDPSGELLFGMNGRWSDSPQLFQRDQSRDYIADSTVEFPLAAERSLDIVFKTRGHPECIGINDESFRFPDLRVPSRPPLTGIITTRIQIDGIMVKCEATFSFSCEDLQLIDEPKIQDLMDVWGSRSAAR